MATYHQRPEAGQEIDAELAESREPRKKAPLKNSTNLSGNSGEDSTVLSSCSKASSFEQYFVQDMPLYSSASLLQRSSGKSADSLPLKDEIKF